MRRLHFVRLMLCCVLTSQAVAQGAAVTLTTNHDASIFSTRPTNSNGAGPGIFAGVDNAGSISRGLLSFNIASAIPAGATIQSVQLTLQLGQVAGAGSSGSGAGGDATPRSIGLYAATASWGEGTTGSTATGIPGTGNGYAANDGDATWNARFYSAITPVNWTAPGGDHVSTSSGATLVGNPASVPAPFAWSSTSGLVADVQSWLDQPGGNFGWELINASESTVKTNRAFYTHDAANSALWPALQVIYSTPEPSGAALAAMGLAAVGVVARRVRRINRR